MVSRTIFTEVAIIAANNDFSAQFFDEDICYEVIRGNLNEFTIKRLDNDTFNPQLFQYFNPLGQRHDNGGEFMGADNPKRMTVKREHNRFRVHRAGSTYKRFNQQPMTLVNTVEKPKSKNDRTSAG